MAYELPDGELPDEAKAKIGALYDDAVEALKQALAADKTIRLDLQCPGCSRRFRKTISVPELKGRLDAARFVAEQSVGRAVPKASASDGPGETLVVFRNVFPSWVRGGRPAEAGEDHPLELLYELAEAVVADTYESQPGRAKEIAGRVYESCGRFKTDGSSVRVRDEWDRDDDPDSLARMGPAS